MLKFRRSWPCLLLLVPAIAVSAPSPIARAQAQEQATVDQPADAEAEGDMATAAATESGFTTAMGRLSTILGSMHFLRELCSDDDRTVWRDEMGAFLKAQAPKDADRQRLIANFNSGYRAFQSTYRRCTPAARLAYDRYQEEGAHLSRDMLTRYGN